MNMPKKDLELKLGKYRDLCMDFANEVTKLERRNEEMVRHLDKIPGFRKEECPYCKWLLLKSDYSTPTDHKMVHCDLCDTRWCENIVNMAQSVGISEELDEIVVCECKNKMVRVYEWYTDA